MYGRRARNAQIFKDTEHMYQNNETLKQQLPIPSVIRKWFLLMMWNKFYHPHRNNYVFSTESKKSAKQSYEFKCRQQKSGDIKSWIERIAYFQNKKNY